MTVRWPSDALHLPEPPDRRTRGEDASTPVRDFLLDGLDRRLCAWVAGLALAALLCLFFGDRMFTLAFGVVR